MMHTLPFFILNDVYDLNDEEVVTPTSTPCNSLLPIIVDAINVSVNDRSCRIKWSASSTVVNILTNGYRDACMYLNTFVSECQTLYSAIPINQISDVTCVICYTSLVVKLIRNLCVESCFFQDAVRESGMLGFCLSNLDYLLEYTTLIQSQKEGVLTSIFEGIGGTSTAAEYKKTSEQLGVHILQFLSNLIIENSSNSKYIWNHLFPFEFFKLFLSSGDSNNAFMLLHNLISNDGDAKNRLQSERGYQLLFALYSFTFQNGGHQTADNSVESNEWVSIFSFSSWKRSCGDSFRAFYNFVYSELDVEDLRLFYLLQLAPPKNTFKMNDEINQTTAFDVSSSNVGVNRRLHANEMEAFQANPERAIYLMKQLDECCSHRDDVLRYLWMLMDVLLEEKEYDKRRTQDEIFTVDKNVFLFTLHQLTNGLKNCMKLLNTFKPSNSLAVQQITSKWKKPSNDLFFNQHDASPTSSNSVPSLYNTFRTSVRVCINMSNLFQSIDVTEDEEGCIESCFEEIFLFLNQMNALHVCIHASPPPRCPSIFEEVFSYFNDLISRRDCIRLIANLIIQTMNGKFYIKKFDGLRILVNHMYCDDSDIMLRESSIFAIRNAIFDNEENQQILSELLKDGCNGKLTVPSGLHNLL